MPRVLICDEMSQGYMFKLKESGFEVDFKPNITGDELFKTVENYDVLIVRGRTKVTASVIAAGKHLKLIGRAGSGLDNIDLEAASSRGIKILNTPEASINAVAELTIGSMICLARFIPKADSSLKKGGWLKSQLIGIELKGKCLGVIGVGRIGSAVAKIAKGFDMHILGHDVITIREDLKQELNIEQVVLDDLLHRSDFISLHVPLTSQTYRLIGEEAIEKMKNTAYLINTSRGQVVDERALYNALITNRIAGAALDVYEVEPPICYDLIRLENVVCTPHIGAQTEEAQELAAELLADKVIEAFARLGM